MCFRDVIAHASQACALPVLKIVEKQLFVEANKVLRMSPEELKERLNGMRAQVGSPWTADEKLSALAAFTALARRSIR